MGVKINHGINFLEGKKSSTFSMDDKYFNSTYTAEITHKDDGTVWLRMCDFSTQSEAQDWINQQKSKVNSFSSGIKTWKTGSSLSEKSASKKYDDLYNDRIIENKPLFSKISNPINSGINSVQSSASSASNNIRNQITSTINTVQSNASSTIQNQVTSTINTVQSNIDNTASLIKLPDLPIPELTKMINEKVNQLAQEMSKNAAQDLIKHQQTLMSSMSSMIAKKSSETFNEMKTSMQQELSKLNINVEISLENNQKEMENKFLNSIGEKTGQTLTEAQSAIQNTIDKVGKGVEEIVKHIEEGEQYVNKQIKNLLDPLQRQIDSQTSKAKQLLSDQYNKMCEKVGENVGQNLAEKFNKAIIDAAHTQYQKIETAKSKATNIAFSATQKAKLKIMSMTGISL